MTVVLTSQPGVPALAIENGPKSPYLSALETMLCFVHALHDLAMEDPAHFGPLVQNPQNPAEAVAFTENMKNAFRAVNLAFNR
jgi:hypothetical protein